MSGGTPARLLIIETSGRQGQVALAVGPQLRGVRRLDETRRHARDLVPALAALLTEQGWRPRDLHGVIVSRGPGSYTGLRVGLMSAQILAYATGCAVLAVDTFAAIARQASTATDGVVVVADAQQENVYVQEFGEADSDGHRQARSALMVEPMRLYLARHDAGAWLTGPGLELWVDRLPAEVRRTESDCWQPRLESLLALGWDRWQRGERDDGRRLEPLYARPSSAEQKWQDKPSKSSSVGGTP